MAQANNDVTVNNSELHRKGVFNNDSTVGKSTESVRNVKDRTEHSQEDTGVHRRGTSNEGDAGNKSNTATRESKSDRERVAQRATRSQDRSNGGTRVADAVPISSDATHARVDAEISGSFPSLNPVYRAVLRNVIGKGFGTETFKKAADGAWFKTRDALYSNRNGIRVNLTQNVHTMLESIREKYSTEEFKAFLDGKEKQFESQADKQAKNFGLHSAEILGKAVETMRQCAAIGRGTGLGGILAYLIQFSIEGKRTCGFDGMRKEGKLSFIRKPFVKAWVSPAAVEVMWGTNDYMTTSRFTSYDGIKGPYMIASDFSVNNILSAVVFAAANGFGYGLDVKHYSSDALGGVSIVAKARPGGANGIVLDILDEEKIEREDYLTSLRNALILEEASGKKNKKTVDELKQDIDKAEKRFKKWLDLRNSDMLKVEEALRIFNSGVLQAREKDEYERVRQQAEKCYRAFAHVLRGTGMDFDAWVRTWMTSSAGVTFRKVAESQKSRTDSNIHIKPDSVREVLSSQQGWLQHFQSPFKASPGCVDHKFSQPCPIMLWAVMHEYVERGYQVDIKTMIGDDFLDTVNAGCNLFSMVHDRACALKGFDYAHTMMGFSPTARRDSIVFQTLRSIFDRASRGIAAMFSDIGCEIVWAKDGDYSERAPTVLGNVNSIPWVVSTMPQRVPVFAWEHFFSFPYKDSEPIVGSTPVLLDYDNADESKLYLHLGQNHAYNVNEGVIRSDWVSATKIAVGEVLRDLSCPMVPNFFSTYLADKSDLATVGTTPWLSVFQASKDRNMFKELVVDYHDREVESITKVINPRSLRVDTKYTIIANVDQSAVGRIDELF